MVEGEDGDAGGNERNDEIFVERVALAEDGQMQKHDGQKLAGFGEDEGDIVDVRQGGIAEWGSQGGGDGDENEGKKNGAGGKYGGRRSSSRGGDEEVDVTRYGGKSRLDGV